MTTAARAPPAFRFRWLSLAMLLTLCAWLCLAVLAFLTARHRVGLVSGGDGNDRRHYHVWDVMPKYAVSLMLGYVYLLPVTSWATAGRVVAYLEHWRGLEGQVVALLGSPLRLPMTTLRRKTLLVSVLCVAVPAVLELMAVGVLPDEQPWMVPVLVHCYIFGALGTGLWVQCCATHALVVRSQATRMAEDVRRLGVAGLRAHRRIWRGLSDALRLMTACWGRMQLLLLAVTFVGLLTSSFMVVCMLLAGMLNLRVALMAMAWCLSGAAIAAICNSAHAAASGMHGPFINQLLRMSLTNRDEHMCTEINLFLEDIRLETTDVAPGNFAVLNRSSILSIFALANTYLVVLSQFTVSESSAVNFSVPEISMMS